MGLQGVSPEGVPPAEVEVKQVHRHGEQAPCAGACGRMSLPGLTLCAECRQYKDKEVRPPVEERDLDIHIEVMEEQLRGERTIRESIEKKGGTRPCMICGRPSLPGRCCCSSGCRSLARSKSGFTFVVDGIEATIEEHSDRRRLKKHTVRKRIQRGASLEEALHAPVDSRPLWERRTTLDRHKV